MTQKEKVELFDKLCEYLDSMSKEEMSLKIEEWLQKNIGGSWKE